MSKRKGVVLIIDDEEEIRESIELLLNSEGLSTDTAANGEQGLKKIEENSYDAVLLDLMLPGKSGMEVQKQIKRIDPTLPVIIITAIGAVETAVTATKEGSFDYITKPWNNEKLVVIATNAIKQRQLLSENMQLRRALKERFGYDNIVGKSEKILRVLDVVSQVAASRSTVLVQGESGTGKELVAKAIHLKSPRADKAFVPVNSGSMPVDLLESTLFGHVRGAFTSAIAAKKGLFEVADQGTIFFDEIGTVGLETQAKLLRVLQEREFMRVGGIDTIKVDVRVIAATNVDLQQAVQEGRLREDLYYRLNVINIHLPPLRERKEDIPALVEHFLAKHRYSATAQPAAISEEALKRLMEYEWPGNVRELENVIERAVVLSRGQIITSRELPFGDHDAGEREEEGGDEVSVEKSFFKKSVAQFEKDLIMKALRDATGNRSKAAEMLGIYRRLLYAKIKEYGLEGYPPKGR